MTLFQLKIGYYPVKKIISILLKNNRSILPWLKCQDQMSCLNQTGNQTLLGCNFLYFIYSSIFFIQIFYCNGTERSIGFKKSRFSITKSASKSNPWQAVLDFQQFFRYQARKSKPATTDGPTQSSRTESWSKITLYKEPDYRVWRPEANELG